MNKIILFTSIILFPLISFSQFFYNANFEERARDGFTKYWQKFPSSSQCSISIDSTIAYKGKYSVKIVQYHSITQDTFSYILSSINTSTLKSVKKVVVTAWVKTNSLNDSDISILLNDESKVLYSRSFVKHKLNDNATKWRKLTITKELREPQKIWQIYLGACVKLDGCAWFDNFKVSIDGKDIGKMPVLTFPETAKKILNESIIKDEEKSSDSFFTKIGNAIGNKYLLGIGEPTHGTHEAYLFKIRLFKYLVKYYRYRIIALENGMAESYKLDRYISGDYRRGFTLSKQEYKSYLNDFLYTQEVIDFIEWMRAYNQSHSEKLSCVGMDVQTYAQCINNLKELIQAIGLPGLIQQVNSIDTNIYLLRLESFDNIKKRQIILEQLDNLEDSCKFRRKLSGIQERNVSWLFKHIDLLRSYLLEDEARWNNFSERTQFMCQNLLWFLKNNDVDKTLIWAHNGHINKLDGPQNIFQREGSLGNFLKLNFGNDYYSVGLYTANGTYSARVSEHNELWQNFPLEKVSKNTIEYYLSMTNCPAFFLDLSHLSTKILPAIFKKNILQRICGMFYDRNQFYRLGALNDLYDGIYFIDESTGTKKLAN